MNLIKSMQIFFVCILFNCCLAFVVKAEGMTNTTEAKIEDFFRSQKTTSAKITLSGNFIAMDEQTGTSYSIVAVNTKNYKKFVIFKGSRSDASLINYHWIDEENIVVELHIEGKGRALIALELTISESKVTAVNQRYLIDNTFVENPLPHITNKFLVSRWHNNGLSVYNVDLSKGSVEGQLRNKFRLNKKAPEVEHWLSDYNGKLNVGYGYDKEDKTNKVWLKHATKDKWNLIWQGKEMDTFQPVLISDDQSQLFVISNEKDDVNTLYSYDLNNKTYGKKLFQIDGVDLDEAILSYDKKEIIGVSYNKNGVYHHEFFNHLESSLNKALDQSFSKLNPYIVDYDANKEIFIVQTSDSTDPGTFHLFKTQSWELLKFASKSPWLNKYNLQQSKLIRSKSVDGMDVESYLTLPSAEATLSAEKPPLIVVPHGGPISVRDTMHYNAHVQFLATSGFAVLQPNYRGSSGYGKEFKKKGMKQWGRLIEDDIDSAVNKAIEEGLVSADKICIYGVSYGGYSALISAVRGSKLYKCVASYAGVTDIPLLFNRQTINDSERLKSLMIDIVGDPDTDIEQLIEKSPVYQADKINVPIFLAQGTDDTIVDIEHFYRMKKTLEYFEKDFKALILTNEGHGFTYMNNLVTFYTDLTNFFNASLNLKSKYIQQLENSALSGDKNDQNKLGYEYESGSQVKQSFEQALYWYEKSAKQNLPIAQNNVGLIYDYGRGVEQDFIKARYWYEKSAESDYAKAYTNLAYLYENGQGVELNYAKAMALFEKAGSLGHDFAWARLARLYEKGLGVEINISEAIKYYEKSDSDYAKERHQALLNDA